MKLAGLENKVERSAIIGFFVLIVIGFVWVEAYALIVRPPELAGMTIVDALLLGLGFAVFHEVAQLIHQLGHALAARSTGYPMSGVRYDMVFTYSEYPANEPPLPDSVHIRRSLGGVVGNAVTLIIVILLRLQTGATAGWFTQWLLNFALVDSLLLMFASVVITDGYQFIRDKGWNTPQG